MVYVAYRRRQNTYGLGGLMRLFYRDGVFYFIVLSSEQLFLGCNVIR